MQAIYCQIATTTGLCRSARLRALFLEALAQLSDGLEEAREYPAAIRQANRLLRTDPLHEETYRRLMRLHLLNNDRVAALRSYHTCAAICSANWGWSQAH